jgi:hypothetical protein
MAAHHGRQAGALGAERRGEHPARRLVWVELREGRQRERMQPPIVRATGPEGEPVTSMAGRSRVNMR